MWLTGIAGVLASLEILTLLNSAEQTESILIPQGTIFPLSAADTIATLLLAP